MIKSGLFLFGLSTVLYSSTALASVDISEKEQVPVSSWEQFKEAVEKSENVGKVIVLTDDIVLDDSFSAASIVSGIIIDGQGHTIKGEDSNKQFLSNKNKDVVIQNVKLDGFSSSSNGGAIYNSGAFSDISADFSNNNVTTTTDARGGAIYNSGEIGKIDGTFTNNDVVSSSYSSYTASGLAGGAIYNRGHIGEIDGDFVNNSVDSKKIAQGGAITNGAIYDSYSSITGVGTIDKLSGDFTGNSAKSETSYAQGGAIYNAGSLTLVNSSFSDNYVETAAEKDSVAGISTQGGAIYNTGDLTIKADGGESIFKGNKVKWADGEEESSAIFMAGLEGTPTLNLDSRNNGLIQFDDKISGMAMIDAMLAEAKAEGAIVTDDGEGGYIIKMPEGASASLALGLQAERKEIHLKKTEGGFIYKVAEEEGGTKEQIEEFVQQATEEGYDVQQDGENYTIKATVEGMTMVMEIIKQEDGTYTMTENIFLSENSGDMVITGDSSSKVVFNNAIEKLGTIDISGTNVDVNEGAGTIYRTVTHDGGVLNINAGAKAEDSIVNKGGTMNVADKAEVRRTEVNDGGVLNVAAGGYAEDTIVNSGGKLSAEAEARLNNMLANGGAILDIDSGVVLTGNIVIDAGATMGGSYDYSQIFKDEVTDKGSLTLVGGLNDVLNKSSLVNTTGQKNLHLTAGSYAIGDGVQAVKGWDMLTFKDNATVKLEGDIYLSGPNKKVIIENGSVLDLAGHSPSDYTINGSVSNDGSMTFTHSGDDADDVTTIYGNYTAYNKAQMTIDVNPTANTSDLLRVDGDVAGTTDVVLNIVGADVRPTERIKFVEALNDDLSTGAYFNIFRVDGSAFKWNSLYEDGAWYTATDDIISDGSENGYGDGDKGNIEDDENLEDDAVLPPNFPDTPSSGGDGGDSGKAPSVVGEAIAYMGLPSAGIEQTRDMTRNITNKVASTKVYSQQCHGFYDCEYDGKALRNAWAAPVYSYSDVKAPYSYEAEISGFEGGFDIQSDVYNRLGVFASYRQGSYDFDGDGDDYYSKVGADMDIDSYILGLYHRYDEGKLWTMGQIFLGYQDVSLSSDDGVSSSTDGIEFGAAVEGGLIFNPMTNLTIEPIIRLAYTQINYDDATDNYGKTAKYGDVRNIEVEAGVKVEKTYLRKNGYAKLYVKPSIIQNIGSGDVQVTSLRKVDGLENSTLGRIEVGGSMSFDEQWSGYANAAYTFGSDYTNLGLNAGLNYAF